MKTKQLIKIAMHGFLLSILLIHTVSLFGQVKTDDVVGVWYVDGRDPAKIEIYKEGTKYYGKIIWLKDPVSKTGNPKTDKHNPDQKLKNRNLVGLKILHDFKFDGKGEWKEGSIYDPATGNTYKSYMWLEGKDKLLLRGFVGISAIGRTEEWKRIK